MRKPVTDYEGHYECPNGCKIDCDTPFYVSAGCVMMPDQSESELGILVYANGHLSNRWSDGTAGIDEETHAMTQDHIDGGCAPNCITCNEEACWLNDVKQADRESAKGDR